jgi:DHA3 family macrolide efflux protein-like MFS transporter
MQEEGEASLGSLEPAGERSSRADFSFSDDASGPLGRGEAGRPHILSPLGTRPIALLWSALAFSALGDQLCTVALSWVAIEAFGPAAGYLTAGYAAIILVVIAFGGGLADRWNRRWSMVAADLLRGTVLVLLVGLWLAGKPPSALGLFCVIAALAIGEALFAPALQSILPALIGEPRLLAATNGLFDATARLARLLGPGLIALAASYLPVMHFFTIDAASFFASALAIASLAPTQAEYAAKGEARSSLRGDFSRGWHATQRDPFIGCMLIANAIVSGVWTATFFLVLPLAISQRHFGGRDGAEIGIYGLVLAIYGVFNLVANIVVGSLGYPRRPAAMAYLGLVLTGAGIVSIAWACAADLPQAWRLPALMLATGFSAIGGPLKDITVATLRQTRIASRDMAAAVRVQLLLSYFCTLVAMLATPLLSEGLGTAPVLALGGGIYLLVAALGWVRPEIRATRP